MRKRTSLLTLLVLALLAAATSAWSAGTGAGTEIKNTAYVTYRDANGTLIGNNVASNEVTTTVTQVAGIDVAAGTAAGSGVNLSTVYYAVDVVNKGNGSDSIVFTVGTTAGWIPSAIAVYRDVNHDNAYDAGDTDLGAGPYNTGALAAEGVYDIIVAVTVPDGDVAAGGATNTVTVSGTAQFAPQPTDSQALTTTANAPVVTVDLVPSDATPVPGQAITFTSTITNGGNLVSGNVSFSIAVPAGFTFVPGSILVGGVAGGNYAAGTVTATLAPLAASGGSNTVVFQATLNSGVASGTNINFVSNASHVVGTKTLSASDTETLIVAAGAGLTVTIGSAADTATPADVTSFPFDVTNGGSVGDTFNLTSAGGAVGYAYIFGTDATCSSAITDTGVMAAGATATFYVCATVPNNAADESQSTITITVTSVLDGTKTYTSGNLVTTVEAPVLSIDKKVNGVNSNNAAPGATLTYTITITNNGTGNATGVVITDQIPANTTYTAGTIQAGYSGSVVGKLDAANGDGAKLTGTTISAGDDGAALNLDNRNGVNKVYILEYDVTVN